MTYGFFAAILKRVLCFLRAVHFYTGWSLPSQNSVVFKESGLLILSQFTILLSFC